VYWIYGLFTLFKGFTIDPMHTVYLYGRQLIGFHPEVNEEKLNQLLLNRLGNRILFYGYHRKRLAFFRIRTSFVSEK
jgi:hypothetical protein